MKDVLPAPEKLDGTRSCELAALLVTLNFTPVDKQMSIASGDGIPGGNLGYWRFLDQHPARTYSLRTVISRGLDPEQAAKTGTDVLPVYREQAYIAAAFHNYRLLVERIRTGARLQLARCGYLYIFRRVEAAAVPELPGAPMLQSLASAGTRRTELAAALATLGFEPTGVRTPPAGAATVTHEQCPVTWMLPATSADAAWQLQERMARWADDNWCAQETNRDPIACMADAFWNLRHLRRSLRDAQRLISIKNGGRSVLIAANAPQAQWDKASQFLKA